MKKVLRPCNNFSARKTKELRPMDNFITKSAIFTISLLEIDSQYSYNKGLELFKNVSSFKLKRFLDKDWCENEKLEELVFSMNIDWTQGWLSIDDCLIEKTHSKKNRRCILSVFKQNK